MKRPDENDWSNLCTQGLSIEQSVLGACLVYPDAVDGAAEMLVPEDFTEQAHQVLFRVIVEARKSGRRMDVGLMKAALAEQWAVRFGEITLGQYVARLVADAPIAMQVREHVRALRDFADYRRLYSSAETLREKAARGMAAGIPSALAIDAIREIDGVVSMSVPPHLRRVSAGEAGETAFDRMQRARAGEKEGKGAPYGIPQLDMMTRGMHPGHLTIVAARPSMGKSAFAVSAALSASRANYPVLFVSLEMPAYELAERALSSLSFDRRSPIPYVSIRAGDIGDDQYERLEEAREYLASLPLSIEQQPGLSPGQIVTRARAAQQALSRDGRRLGLVVVDHLGKVRPSDRYAGNRTTELGEITSAMKDMAGELACNVMVLCQLNRQTEQRDNKRPTLGDLRESGRIEEDADNVLMLYREAYYQERTKSDGESDFDRRARISAVENEMEIIIAKQRQGETGIVEAWCSMPCNVIQGLGFS